MIVNMYDNLSIVIIAKNEEHIIGQCLASVVDLGLEILVLINQSTDKTEQIAHEYGAKVINIDWQGYGKTKNLGAKMAKNKFILSLDADEVLDAELQKSIQIFLKKEAKATAYFLQRDMVFLNKKLKGGSAVNEKIIRLYNKEEWQWDDRNVHEKLISLHHGKAEEKLNGCLLHYSYKDREDMRARLLYYSQLWAKDKKIKFSEIKKFSNSLFAFIKNYFLKKGFLDGKIGFIFSLEQARYVYNKYKLINKI